jgi:hypothetical protein
MFGRSNKPVTFDPYAGRRSRRRVPRWLLLLLGGIGLGAGGLYFAQERYLPPRLSPAESAKLRGEFDTADAARRRLEGELQQTRKRLDETLVEQKKLTGELTSARAEADSLKGNLGSLVAAFPPDPRGGSVEVRAARITGNGASVNYDVLLTRGGRNAGKPLDGSVRFTVEGDVGGVAKTFVAPALPVAMGAQEVLRGELTLPEGMRPRQVTIQIMDRAGGRQLGMRVHKVK